ncbi:MAG: NAD(P)-dependent alcohol dehydrogenase [Bacteroidia bacterium]
MKAAIRRNYGTADKITVENVSIPQLKEDQILIEVFATTVNRTDCANLTAKPFIMRFVLGLFKPRKIILGTDFSGKVTAVGKNVNKFKVNEHVFGFVDTGSESQAEFVVNTESQVFKMPDNIDFKSAVASLEGGHYAYSFTHKVEIQNGQSVFINGASGAIGSALLQFVSQYDVKVSASCSTKNIELIKSLGAETVFDYTKEDFTEDTNQYDFIFDAVGKTTFGKCKHLLKKHGVYISSELGPYAQNIFLALFTPLFNKRKVIFPIPFAHSKTIPFIIQNLENETFKPVIDKTYKLEDIAEAYKYVSKGMKTGNVIVDTH